MGSAAGPGAPPDPVRATLVAILRQLNQADTANEGEATEQALELPELESRLTDFWAVERGSIKVSLAVGLLLRNGLVAVQAPGDYSWQRQRTSQHRYQITPAGKKFLVESISTSDRIP
ncbi:MAG TPA: hypothetical protein VIZ68_07185 [Thermoplasmata archaeon]